MACRCTARGLPHARGGVSEDGRQWLAPLKSSPRTWGCFSPGPPAPRRTAVFPTHVGVFPPVAGARQRRRGLPHARGGVSDYLDLRPAVWLSSPRTWGCFSLDLKQALAHCVFPTHVGVFLMCIVSPVAACSLPHARGGVSPPKRYPRRHHRSSPRTWGCFYFFNRALMHTKGLPHARGGVSRSLAGYVFRRQSSPRTWGCF